MLCQLDDWLQEHSSLLIFLSSLKKTVFIYDCCDLFTKYLKNARCDTVEVHFILLLFTVIETHYWTNCWIYDFFFCSFKCWWLFSGFCELPSYFFFSVWYMSVNCAFTCNLLPYNVYTYTSNCWINRSIITLEPQPAFTTCAGLFDSILNETG